MKYVIFESEYAMPEAMIFSDNVIHKVAAGVLIPRKKST